MLRGGREGRAQAVWRGTNHVSAWIHAGADAATGRWILFLHADCRLPSQYFAALAEAVNRPAGQLGRGGSGRPPAWGCFRSIDTGLPSMSLVRWGVAMRTRWRSRPYGDQALFCSRAHFQQVRSADRLGKAWLWMSRNRN